jgi:hypothetical protein
MAKVKFKKLGFSKLPNAAHYFFCRKVSQQLAASPSTVTSVLGPYPAQFNTDLAEEKKCMDWVALIVLTEDIREAGKRMDHGVTAIRIQVHAQEYNPAQAICEAARRVYAMLQHYGRIIRKPYEEQEGDVLAILEQLQSGGAYYGDANTLGIYPLVSELQSAFTLFQQLLRQRDRKSLLKPSKTFRRVRRDLEASYYPMVELIDAGAALNTPSAFATFINDLNPEIERLNAEFHPVRIDISACEPEPIQPQAYTGLPLTPSPVVLFRTPHDGTVRLELGRDYNLVFRNNTEVGNAECTIVGKGKYRGRKTVTFVIVRPV